MYNFKKVNELTTKKYENYRGKRTHQRLKQQTIKENFAMNKYIWDSKLCTWREDF